MKIIYPSQVSGEIMNLMDEADQIMIIVSPYNDFRKWEKMRNKLLDLKKRNVKVEYYTRSPNNEYDESRIEEIKALQFTPILLDRLHCKLYLNEKSGIVSSLNLVYGSDAASLDIGHQTETDGEYLDLIQFVDRHIRKRSLKAIDTFQFNENRSNIQNARDECSNKIEKNDWLSQLSKNLKEIVQFEIIEYYIKENKGFLKVGKLLFVFEVRQKDNQNYLRYSADLGSSIFQYLKLSFGKYKRNHLISFTLLDSSKINFQHKAVWELNTIIEGESNTSLRLVTLNSNQINAICDSIKEFIVLIQKSPKLLNH